MKIKLSKEQKKCVTEPTILAEILQLLLTQRDETDKMKEIFYVIGLDTRNNIQYIEIVSIGTLTASLVHPRETFRIAIMQNSAHIIIAHNHPNVVVRTALRTRFAADTGLGVNVDCAGILIPMNGTCWAADHTHRIFAVHTSLCKQPGPVLWTRTYEQRSLTVVCRRTGAHTVIAARTTFRVNDHRLTTIHQSMID